MSQIYFKNAPLRVTLKANVKFAYCTCGLAQTFPYCNGSHRGTEHKPIKITPQCDTTLLLCQCGKSKNAHECDNSHVKGNLNADS
jgi:CDGSH-type Zn-finger protein